MSASTAWSYVQVMTVFLAEALGQQEQAVAGKVCLVDPARADRADVARQPTRSFC